VSNFWVFALGVALVIAWFVLDRPVMPGEAVSATVAEIAPINIPAGPPNSRLIAKLPDGATVTLQIPRNDKLNPGDAITLRKTKRRLSGIAAYEVATDAAARK
jgi:hypothetical protein